MNLPHVLMAFALSVTGGLVGAMLFGAARGAPLQHTVDWGTLVAGLTAALGALYLGNRAVEVYMRQQERDEVSRRFVDEGVDRLGRELAAMYAMHINDLGRLNIATLMAVVKDREGVLALLHPPVNAMQSVRFEAARLCTQLRSTVVRQAFDVVFADFERIGSYTSQTIPSMIRSQLEVPMDVAEQSQQRVQVLVALLVRQLSATHHELVDGLAQLSVAFQAARIGNIEQAMNWADLPALRPAVDAFVARATAARERRTPLEDTPALRQHIEQQLEMANRQRRDG